MAVRRLGVMTLGEIQVSLGLAVGLIQSILDLIAALISGKFGITAVIESAMAEIQGLLGAQLSIALRLADPMAFVNLIATLSALVTTLINANANMLLDLLPEISINATAIAGVAAKVAAALSYSVGLTTQQLAAVQLLSDLLAALSSGGVAYYVGHDAPMAVLGQEFAAALMDRPAGFNGTQNAYAVLMVAETPATQAVMRTIFAT